MPAKILLDECVTMSLGGCKQINRELFHCSVKLVGSGATDDQVMQFAKDNGYLLATNDQKFVTRCLRNNVPVAYCVNGKAHVLAISQVFDLPITARGAPIKVKKARRKRKRSLWAKLARLLR